MSSVVLLGVMQLMAIVQLFCKLICSLLLLGSCSMSSDFLHASVVTRPLVFILLFAGSWCGGAVSLLSPFSTLTCATYSSCSYKKTLGYTVL